MVPLRRYRDRRTGQSSMRASALAATTTRATGPLLASYRNYELMVPEGTRLGDAEMNVTYPICQMHSIEIEVCRGHFCPLT